VLWSGLLYTIGRSLAYTLLGLMIVQMAVSTSRLSLWLQLYFSRAEGILLILAGMYLLDLLPIRLPGLSAPERLSRAMGDAGVLGALPLGSLFALAFCPVSAALFFGSLVPMAIREQSPLILPFSYGLGTGIPVMGFALLMALGATWMSRVSVSLAAMERFGRKATGVVLVLVGIYSVLTSVFGLF
jgi:cytochrome c biogenesis protein CcdA